MLVQSHDGAVHLLPALPDSWTSGEVKGVRARGGFVVDEQWREAKLHTAKVRSTIGGVLRLRSYVPLRLAKAPKGAVLTVAKGACPNALFMPAAIRQPLQSAELKDFQKLPLRPVYEYDIDTQAGQTYVFVAQ